MNLDYSDRNFIIIFIIIYLVFLLILIAWSIVSYILSSMSLYSISRRRGIRGWFLSWVPVV